MIERHLFLDIQTTGELWEDHKQLQLLHIGSSFKHKNINGELLGRSEAKQVVTNQLSSDLSNHRELSRHHLSARISTLGTPDIKPQVITTVR